MPALANPTRARSPAGLGQPIRRNHPSLFAETDASARLPQVLFPYAALLASFAATATLRPAAGDADGLLDAAARLLSPVACGAVRQVGDAAGPAAAGLLYVVGVPWLLRKAWGVRGGGLADGLRDLDPNGDGRVGRLVFATAFASMLATDGCDSSKILG